MNIEDMKGLLDAFDPASLLPELDGILALLVTLARWAVMIGPAALVVLGLGYMFLAPREANYYFGYRCFFGMGSEEAWRYTQRIAGLIWTALGLVLTAVMFFVSRSFGALEPVQALPKALICLLWEAGLIAVSCLAINTLAAVFFDAQGQRRRRR